METHLIPQNPRELLMLAPSTATSIDLFSDGIIHAVKLGEVNPLAVVVQLKAMEQATERISKEIKPELMTEVGKYPEKDFEFMGNKISKAEHGTKYEFGECGDPEWTYCNTEVKRLSAIMKERETFLKTLKSPIEVLDTFSGELISLSPPTKTSVSGINISIK